MTTEQKMKRLVQGWRNGDTVKEIAKATGYSEGSIYQTVARLRAEGIELEHRQGGRKKSDRSNL